MAGSAAGKTKSAIGPQTISGLAAAKKGGTVLQAPACMACAQLCAELCTELSTGNGDKYKP